MLGSINETTSKGPAPKWGHRDGGAENSPSVRHSLLHHSVRKTDFITSMDHESEFINEMQYQPEIDNDTTQIKFNTTINSKVQARKEKMMKFERPVQILQVSSMFFKFLMVDLNQPNSKIWSEFRLYPDRTHDADKILYNDIKTWAFPTSNRVHIYCNLHMCLQKCPEIICNNGSKIKRLSKKRTKRQISMEKSTSNDTFRLESGYEVSKFLNVENERRQSELLIAVENDRNNGNNPKICLSEKNFFLLSFSSLLANLFNEK
uniref:ZP domain-containing protein n=1 Tax=Romanomermis culicivorax TaxID=13658 RepID=A0A915L8E9_ROMCU